MTVPRVVPGWWEGGGGGGGSNVNLLRFKMHKFFDFNQNLVDFILRGRGLEVFQMVVMASMGPRLLGS